MPNDCTGYFSSDYQMARSRFRQMVEKAGGRLDYLELDAKGPNNEDLSIDIGWFGTDSPERVLLHSSGLHGVEGFAGSAIQLQLLDHLPSLPKDCSLVLVHVLNPYGMAWLRRVNEGNVDLNRNFIESGIYAGAPKDYGKFDSFLNPRSLPHQDFYLLRAGLLIFRYGIAALKQSVAGGQYEYPKGLFFGGERLQQGPQKYRTYLSAWLAGAKQVLAIDVHTGLGRYGEDSLLVAPEKYEKLRCMFGGRVAPLEARRGPAYSHSGGLETMLLAVMPQAEVHFVVQEFGTYSLSAVVHALREENRWHHYGEATLRHPTKQHLKETFYPDDDFWQTSVLIRGQEVLKQALANIVSMSSS